MTPLKHKCTLKKSNAQVGGGSDTGEHIYNEKKSGEDGTGEREIESERGWEREGRGGSEGVWKKCIYVVVPKSEELSHRGE